MDGQPDKSGVGKKILGTIFGLNHQNLELVDL